MIQLVMIIRGGSWKVARSSFYYHSHLFNLRSAVFLEGHIHWLAKMPRDQKPTIVIFNLAEEKFYEMPPPNSSDNYKLDVVGGRLCIFDTTGNDFWVMKRFAGFVFIGEEEVVLRYHGTLFGGV